MAVSLLLRQGGHFLLVHCKIRSTLDAGTVCLAAAFENLKKSCKTYFQSASQKTEISCTIWSQWHHLPFLHPEVRMAFHARAAYIAAYMPGGSLAC